MSVDYKLACDDCKEYIWIAQNGCPPETAGTFYSGEPHTMEGLKIFLYKHYEHTLRFVTEYYADYFEGWKEIDTDIYKTNLKEGGDE